MATSAPELSDTEMVPLSAAIGAIAKHLGFDDARLRTVARALQEAGQLQLGAPHAGPRLDLHDVMTLIIGIAADVSLHRTAEAVAAIDTLVSEGAPPVETLPAHLKHKLACPAGSQLDAIASLMAGGDNYMRRLRIEIVAEPWREVAVHFPGGSVQRFLARGALPGHWGANGYRKSVTLNGAALADAIDSLFGI